MGLPLTLMVFSAHRSASTIVPSRIRYGRPASLAYAFPLPSQFLEQPRSLASLPDPALTSW